MNPYLDIAFRSVSVYIFMVIALNLFGKKELSQLNSADIILILLISNSVQNAMVGSDSSLLGGIIAAIALLVINFIFKKVIRNSKFIKNIIEEEPLILIRNGKSYFKNLTKTGITSDELEEAMREHGVEHYKDVKLAMFEIDGSISIIAQDNILKQTHHKRKIHKTLGTINN